MVKNRWGWGRASFPGVIPPADHQLPVWVGRQGEWPLEPRMWPQLMGWELGQVPDSLVCRSLELGELCGRTVVLLPMQPACAGPAER